MGSKANESTMGRCRVLGTCLDRHRVGRHVPGPSSIEVQAHRTRDGGRNRGEVGRRISEAHAYARLEWERSEQETNPGKQRKQHILVKYVRT